MNAIVVLMVLFIISLASIQAVPAENLLGEGDYYDAHGALAGSWEMYEGGTMLIWYESDVYKLTFCQHMTPPYEYTWERYTVDAGDPTNELYWIPRDRGVGRMADDPTTVETVEDEGYTYCWYSGPKDVGYGWAPYGRMSYSTDTLSGGISNGQYAALPSTPGDYGGDLANCGLCTGKDIFGTTSPTQTPVPPGNTVQIPAIPEKNSLSGSERTRGFGDATEADFWIPFDFTISNPKEYKTAKIVMRVKPVGDPLTTTDDFVLKGASGSPIVIYNKFSELQAGTWSEVEIDLINEVSSTESGDILAAIKTGRLEGMIQDDTAVESVTLIVGD